MKEVNIEEP